MTDLIPLVLDFESPFDGDYSLKKMPTCAYVRDERFDVLGAGVRLAGGPAVWLEPDALTSFLAQVPWENTQVIAHNCQFDSLVLTEYYGYRPRQYACTMFMLRWLISQGHLDPRMGTSLAEAAPLVGMEKGNLEQALANDTLGEYATDDAAICAALYDKYWHLLPEDEQGFIDIHVRMAVEPVFGLDREALRALADADKALEELFPLVRKDDLFAAALSALGVSPEYKTTAKGNLKLALAKNDKFMQRLQGHPDPSVRLLAETRLRSRSTINRSRAQRFLDVGAPLPAPILYYGAHCVPGDAEVLTPTGWVQIMDWRGGDIAQWSEDGTVCFAPATPFHGPEISFWLDCDAPFAPGRFTPGHTIPRYPNRTGALSPCSAETAATKAQTILPVGGVLAGADGLTDAQARVLVMVQADGYWDRDDVRVQVKKPRKIERARRLFAAAGLSVRERELPSQPGYVRFWVPRGECPAWLSPSRKQLGAWVLGNPGAVATELVHWDGWTQGGKDYYATTNAASAEWAQTACHLSGWSASVTCREDARPNRRALFVVGIRKRDKTFIYRGHWKPKAQWGRTYCAQTKTGYWLMRYNGHIQVTGNTGRGSGLDKLNVQNLPRAGGLREAILAPEGYKLVVVDSSQIEVRVNAWLAGQEDLLEDFRQGRDPYLSFAAFRYGQDYDGLVARYKAGDAEVAKWRQICKAAVLALGFMQGEGGFEGYCETNHVPLAPGEGGDVVRTYRQKHRAIVQLANRALAEIRETGRQQAPNGTCLTYPDLRITATGDIEWRRPRIFAKSVNEGWGTIWRGAAIENCLYHYTEVLTCHGWVPLARVTTRHRVWDGVEWVQHSGFVDQGVRPTLNFGGVWMTPDHKVLTSAGFLPAEHTTHGEACGHTERLYWRTPGAYDRHSALGVQWAPDSVARALRLRGRASHGGGALRQGRGKNLRSDGVPEQKPARPGYRGLANTWHVTAPRILGVEVHARPLQVAYSSGMAELRSAWDSGLRAVGRSLRCLLGGHGAYLPAGAYAGAGGQPRGLRADKLPVGGPQGSSPEQANQRHYWHPRGADVGLRGGGTEWAESHNAVVSPLRGGTSGQHVQPPTLQPVGDLLNAGPRHRFTVRGADGRPFIVSNCVQKVARDVVFWQGLQAHRAGYRIVLMVHDEVVLLAKDEDAEATLEAALGFLRTPPPWAADLPLGAEGTITDRYTK